MDEGFVAGRAEIAEAAVEAAGVVPAFDPVEDGPVEAGDGRPGATVDEFSFDGGEEALGDGVVPACSFASQRQGTAVIGGELAEVPAGVLAAAVGVEDRPGRWAACVKALNRASEISSVRMWSASAQPTTLRLARSITVARYAQPSQVAI